MKKLYLTAVFWLYLGGIALADVSFPELESGMHYITDGTGGHALASGIGVWTALQIHRHGEITHELFKGIISVSMILGINKIVSGTW